MKTRPSFVKDIVDNKTLLIMLLPAVLFFLIIAYLPMLGSLVAFKEYNIRDGLLFSPWSGLYNFKFFFISGKAWHVVKNTMFYNTVFIITGNFLQMGVAILLAEMTSKFYRKLTQSLMFLPYFISWVIVGSFLYNIFNYEYGIINTILINFGLDPINVYGLPDAWKYIIIFFNNWKWVGYGSVLYLASIMSISVELYEASEIDGANVFQKIRRITIPLLKPTLIVLILLSIGRIFRGDFDMFYQLVGDSGNLFAATDVIDTFVFRALVRSQDIGMASAAAFFQSVMCFVTVIVVNGVVRKVDKDSALF
jgi:putative aldouronate transport system permease protein